MGLSHLYKIYSKIKKYLMVSYCLGAKLIRTKYLGGLEITFLILTWRDGIGY